MLRRSHETCRILARHYAERVHLFLREPPPAWLRAMGYDTDFAAFSRDCERWKRLVTPTSPPPRGRWHA